jgi:hypothetical protein
MQQTDALKLTVYKPDIAADGQVGFEYELTLVIPDDKAAVSGTAPEASASARCEVVPVTGELSFPNPAAPVISPFTGLMFIYDDAPAIGFPLTIMARSTDDSLLPFSMNLCFPASPVDVYSGAIVFGEWPGPLSNVTAPFLAPQA